MALKKRSATEFTLKQALQKRIDNNALRTLIVNDKLTDFCSNDYLGFARSQQLKKSIDKFKLKSKNKLNGSGGSRLLSGNTAFAEELEKEIAKFHKAQAGLIYNSGYDANIGLLSCIAAEGDTIIYDELAHASIHDGIKLSKASAYMFRHNDLEHLQQRLQIASGTVYVVVESVYSMDGDICLLKEITALCKKYNANLIVDEAHTTGVIGKNGEGLVCNLKLEKKVFARVHTFGKALGCHGAVVLGSKTLREYLINFSRSFIYTTALPPHSLVAIKQAYQLLKNRKTDIKKLKKLISYFRANVAEHKNLSFIERDRKSVV